MPTKVQHEISPEWELILSALVRLSEEEVLQLRRLALKIQNLPARDQVA